MPQLDGLSYNTETIRTYFSFYISRLEIETVKNDGMQMLVNQFMQKGVIEICSDCTRKGYYIVGLERGEITQGEYPGLPATEAYSYALPYYLTLGLYVRRFMDKLTGDELYYWSKQSSERILYEMNQLGQGPSDVYVPKSVTGDVYGLPTVTSMVNKMETLFESAEIAEGTITNVGANTVPASAVSKVDFAALQGLLDTSVKKVLGDSAIKIAIDESNRKEEKPKLYKIIRRPKLCSSLSS